MGRPGRLDAAPRRPTTSRRTFLRNGGLALGAMLGRLRPAGAAQARPSPPRLPDYVVDVDGDGRLGVEDVQVVRAALNSTRGFQLAPRSRHDFRADLFGRGAVGSEDLDSVTQAVRQGGQKLNPRPITIAWHYGWYNGRARPTPWQTARFLGGNYASSDPAIEGTFNQLKNEFGITVDALSWIPFRKNQQLESNYLQGYLQAPGAATRHVALLYESTISLPRLVGERIHFLSDEVRGRLVEDFGSMGRFFAAVRDHSPARVFTLDGRPVIFLFGSHTWGLSRGSGVEFDAMDVAIKEARGRFAVAYGALPYLVGEEMLLSNLDVFEEDRRRRTVNFDAAFAYHHASNSQGVLAAGRRLQDVYRDLNTKRLRLSYAAIRPLRNRYTGQRILIIPSLAAGFAKPGLPSLLVTRGGYADFMKQVVSLHTGEYLLPDWWSQIGTAPFPAPVYSVGSWNEEFEGHAVFPANFNLSLAEMRQFGFDLVMAIKQVFGWNHYSRRPIRTP